MSTVTTTFEALLSGWTWNGEEVTGQPVFITYSFETAPADYLTGLASAEFLASFQPFTAAEQDEARRALQAWAETSGVTFFEVPAGQGDIRFGSYEFSLEEGVEDSAGFAYYPAVLLFDRWAFDVPYGGDVFVDHGFANFDVLVHEVGHALGLKHPFEDDPVLDEPLDDLAHTVMTYNEAGGPATALGTFDVEAVRYLYGGPESDGAHLASWSWDASAYVLTQAGGSESDTILGVAVRDVISGGDGGDFIFSRAGADQVEGGGGDDTLAGGEGQDTLAAGAGADIVSGDEENDSASGGDGHDDIWGDAGDDTLAGDAGNDTLWAADGSLDHLRGGDGDDMLVMGSGAVVADGGAGEDALWYILPFGSAGSVLSYSTLTAGGGAYSGIEIVGLWGDIGGDTITGGELIDALVGDAGSDSIAGAAAGDELWGDSGADTIAGGEGDDLIVGGSGADLLQPGAGRDVLWGGSGSDTVDYSGETESASVTVNAVRLLSGGGSESMSEVENLIGTAFNDSLRGDDQANQLFGRGGDDTLTGRDGLNYLRGEEGNDSVEGGAAFDDLHGNMGNDTVAGGGGDDWVVGGKDQDFLYGDAGLDRVLGNLGSDTIDGGADADVVRGGQANDVVLGGAGDDWLAGDRGDDTVTGGTGADIFHSHGEAGLDRVTDFNRAEGDRVNLLPGTTYAVAQVGADVVITMAGGGQMVLVGVQLAALTGDWIFVA